MQGTRFEYTFTGKKYWFFPVEEKLNLNYSVANFMIYKIIEENLENYVISRCIRKHYKY